MEIIKLLPEGKTECVIAKPFLKEATEDTPAVTYFNILHGSDQQGYYQYKIFLDNAVFKDVALAKKDGYQLVDKNYLIRPIYRNSELMMNHDKDCLYTLTKDENGHLHNSTLVLWEIPNFLYKDVKYKVISGYVVTIGKGKNGIERNGVKYTSPAPVIEIMGDVVIEWTGKSTLANNEIVGERLTRKNGVWTSEQINER